MFLVDAGTPGFEVVRAHRRARPRRSSAGTARCASTDCRVPDDAVLGEAGQGFNYAQVAARARRG